MLRKNLLVSSQELIISTGLLSCLFYSERWYENKSHSGTLCFAGTKQEHSQESFSLCNPALCTYPSINRGKNSSTHKFVTAHMRSAVTPDQNLLLGKDETPRKILFSASGVTLDLYENKSAPNAANCVYLVLVFKAQKTTILSSVWTAAPKPVYCKKGAPLSGHMIDTLLKNHKQL